MKHLVRVEDEVHAKFQETIIANDAKMGARFLPKERLHPPQADFQEVTEGLDELATRPSAGAKRGAASSLTVNTMREGEGRVFLMNSGRYSTSMFVQPAGDRPRPHLY